MKKEKWTCCVVRNREKERESAEGMEKKSLECSKKLDGWRGSFAVSVHSNVMQLITYQQLLQSPEAFASVQAAASLPLKEAGGSITHQLPSPRFSVADPV
jgi:hypothetical protein